MYFGPVGVKQSIYQGSGAISAIPEILTFERWQRVMIMADPGVAKGGMIKSLEEMLKTAGIEYCLFTNIRPNPEPLPLKMKSMFKEFR